MRSSLSSIPRDLAVLAVSMFIWGLGEGLFIFFYPLALQSWGMNTVQIGTVLSLIGVIMALVQVPSGYLADHVGARLLMRAASILGIGCALTMAAAQTRPVFIAGILAYGFTSFIVAPLNSYITSQRGSWSVQRAITFISASMQAGAIAGPVLGGWIAEAAGLPTVFRYSTGLFLVATLVIFLARRPAAQEEQEATAHLASPLANPRFFGFLVIVLLTIFALNLPMQLTSVYLQDVHHLSLQQIGATGTIASIGTAVIMFALGNLRAPAGMLVGQLLIAGFSLFMWRGRSAAVFYMGYLFYGGIRLYRAMALAFARPLVKMGDIGLAYGLVETGNALAIIPAPLAAGFLYNYQPAAMFTVSLVALAITVLLNAVLASRQHDSIHDLDRFEPDSR